MPRLRTPLLASLLCLCLGLPVYAGGQQAGDDVIVDEDYRFRLRRPGQAWRLLGEQEVRNVVPDAVAGAVSVRGVYGVIIVEPAAGIDLDVFAETIVDNMPVEDMEIFSRETIEIQGRPARRIGVLGKIDDVVARYRLTVFANQGFAYQINVFSAATLGGAWERDYAAFERSLSLLEGKPQARNSARAIIDRTGAGWRVKDGVFESAAYALRVAPRAPWTLIVGDELRNLNADAEVGLQCSDPEAYLLLVPETYGGDTPDLFAGHLRRAFEEGLDAPKSRGTRRIDVLGKSIEVAMYDVNIGIDINFWYGVRILAGTCIQMQGWYPKALEARAAPLLEQAMRGIEHLGGPEVRALGADLAQEFASRTRVGPDHALRGGTYRNYTHDFTFTRPAEGYWRISTGQEAREKNADSLLMIEEPREGLFGQVICERDLDMEPLAFHEAVVGMVWGPDAAGSEAKPEALVLDGVPALRHGALVDVDGVPLWYEVVTLIHRGSAIQITASGLPGNRARIVQAAERMRTGFAFPAEGLRAVERTPVRYVDHRLGFAVDLRGSLSRLRDQTPERVRAVGSMLLSTGPDGMTGYVAVCSLNDGQDEMFFLKLTRDILARSTRASLRGEPTREVVAFRGLPATKLTWVASGTHLEALLIWRDRTVYLVIDGHTGDAPREGQSAADRLTFVD